MELEFKKYQATESTLESLGTIKDIVGTKGSIAFIPSNIRDTKKRVVVILKKGDGKSTMVTCSQKVSDGIRDKSITEGHLLGFEVLYGENEIPFITLPGGGLIEYAVKDIKAVDFVATAVSLEDLIA